MKLAKITNMTNTVLALLKTWFIAILTFLILLANLVIRSNTKISKNLPKRIYSIANYYYEDIIYTGKIALTIMLICFIVALVISITIAIAHIISMIISNTVTKSTTQKLKALRVSCIIQGLIEVASLIILIIIAIDINARMNFWIVIPILIEASILILNMISLATTFNNNKMTV